MPHKTCNKIYTKRVTSLGESVMPAVCATYYKLPQQQADKSGGYILDYFKKVSSKNNPAPLTPEHDK